MWDFSWFSFVAFPKNSKQTECISNGLSWCARRPRYFSKIFPKRDNASINWSSSTLVFTAAICIFGECWLCHSLAKCYLHCDSNLVLISEFKNVPAPVNMNLISLVQYNRSYWFPKACDVHILLKLSFNSQFFFSSEVLILGLISWNYR